MINLLNMDKGSRTPSSRWATRFLKKMHLDLFLFIDFRRDYLVAHKAMPNIPVSPRRHDLADAHIAPCPLAFAHSCPGALPLHRSFSGHVIHARRSKSRASRWNCALPPFLFLTPDSPLWLQLLTCDARRWCVRRESVFLVKRRPHKEDLRRLQPAPASCGENSAWVERRAEG